MMDVASSIYAGQYKFRQWIVSRYYSLYRKVNNPGEGQINEAIAHPQRILVVLAGLIGDSVMSVPVITEAKRLWPSAKLTLLGKKSNCDLLADCPAIDSMLEASAIPFTMRKRKEVAVLVKQIREADFDLAIILLGDQFAPLLAKVGIPVRVGVKGHLLESCLTHTYDIRSPREWGPPERLGALRCLGFEVSDCQPELWIPEASRLSAGQKLAEKGLSDHEQYIVIHPFGSTSSQWWSQSQVKILAERLQNEFGLKSVLIGGPETSDSVISSLNENVINTTGDLTLSETMAVIQRATLMISTDSGPFHIGGALRRPLIGLFRARRPEHAHRYSQALVILGETELCQRMCEWDRCQADPCSQLSMISAERVMVEVRKIFLNEVVC